MNGRFCILASGSASNCAVLSFGGSRKTMLIDAGLSPRSTRNRMIDAGFDPASIGALLFTHFDSDHIHAGWQRELAARPIPVLVRHGLDGAARERGIPGHCIRVVRRATSLGSVASLRCWETPHDQLGSTAWRIDTPCGSIGYATDLGRVHPQMTEGFTGVDVLAIEANYDTEMQVRSSRPEYLKERIMGGSGHLSNSEALEAVGKISHGKCPSTVFLLHLSADCNCPELLQSQVERTFPSQNSHIRVVPRNTPSEPLLLHRPVPQPA